MGGNLIDKRFGLGIVGCDSKHLLKILFGLPIVFGQEGLAAKFKIGVIVVWFERDCLLIVGNG